MKLPRVSWIFALLLFGLCIVRAETLSIIIGTNAAPRVEFGAEKLAAALRAVKVDAAVVRSMTVSGRKIHLETPHNPAVGHEGFRIDLMGNRDLMITSGDDS